MKALLVPIHKVKKKTRCNNNYFKNILIITDLSYGWGDATSTGRSSGIGIRMWTLRSNLAPPPGKMAWLYLSVFSQGSRAMRSLMEIRLKHMLEIWHGRQATACENLRNQTRLATKMEPQKGRSTEICCLAVVSWHVVVQSSILWWVWSYCQHQEAKLDAKWRNRQCRNCQASLPLDFTISDDVLRVRPLLHFCLPNLTHKIPF